MCPTECEVCSACNIVTAWCSCKGHASCVTDLVTASSPLLQKNVITLVQTLATFR